MFVLALWMTGCSITSANEVDRSIVTPPLEQAAQTATPEPSLPTATTGAAIETTAPVVEMSPTPHTRPTLTIHPGQVEGYISNPYMGWQDTQRKDKRFVETVGYRRMNWRAVNPAEGSYDWSMIESLRADMTGLGGKISFRIRTAQPPPWGDGQAMPDWLVKQGAKIVEGGTDVEEVRGTEPLYAGCLFLEAHGQFIEAMRQRYDGDPDVAFIDLGSYGTYGEWDSEQYNDEPGSLDWHARRRIIDMYLGGQGTRPCLKSDGQITQASYNYAGFQKTRLVMPYTPAFPDSLEYALSRRQDVGIRHDALGSEKHQNRYRKEIAGLVEKTWPRAPIVFEFYPTSYTPEALRSARDFAQEMHASFIHDNFDGRGSHEDIERVLAVIGYRLTLQEITYTSELHPGENLAFEMVWKNTGVAPPYFETYPLVLSLTNAQGVVVLDQKLEPDIREWLPGQVIRLPGLIPLPANLPGGQYDLRVAFVDQANRPVLALAITGRDEQGRYLLGPVKVLPKN